MTLKDLRIEKELTQIQASQYAGIPLRTYKQYENDETKTGTIKYQYLCEKLEKYNYIDEEHGILKIEKIKNILNKIFAEYNVDFCYLFGSYAKGTATEKSDIDLLISTNVEGLRFFGLIEKIRQETKKKIDLLDVRQLRDNTELITEILKTGIKIYG